jgi:predicted HAD superfamily Cof-like phosphohydrolase
MTQTLMQMVKEYKDTSGQKSSVELSRKLVWEEYEEWEYEVNCPEESSSCEIGYYHDIGSYAVVSLEYSAKDELKELADLVYVLGGYALAKGWDLDEALKRVHANNVGRMFQPDGSILRREDGKILKNKGYAKVDLEDLV